MLQLSYRHIRDPIVNLLRYQLQSLVELVNLTIIMQGLVVTKALHHPLRLQGPRS